MAALLGEGSGGMDNRFNTIAGWALAGGIVLLGTTLVAGEYFKGERPEHMGYAIPGVVEDSSDSGPAADPPIALRLASADIAAGQASFAKCQSCHTITQGGPNQMGPNLWGTVGEPIGQGKNGYAFSSVLSGHGGTWTFENLDEWLKSPQRFASGTKMSFAGLSDPQERANVIAYLNSSGSNLPLPPPPAAAPAGGNEAAAADGNAAAANAAAPAANAAAPAGNSQ
jgi:cytochrome c